MGGYVFKEIQLENREVLTLPVGFVTVQDLLFLFSCVYDTK